MSDLDEIKRLAAVLASRAEQASTAELSVALEKLTAAFKSAAESEKLVAETRKFAADEEKTRYDLKHSAQVEAIESRQRYIALLTPVITTLILVFTLLFQTFQFLRSERDKQDALEATQWAEAVKTVSQLSGASSISVVLRPFLNSEHYGGLARSTAVQVLSRTNDVGLFTDLFRTVFVPIRWENLDEVLQLDRSLSSTVGDLAEKTFDKEKKTNDLSKLTPEQKRMWDYGWTVYQKISGAMGPLLKEHRPAEQHVNLESAWFYASDWTGADLSGANLYISTLRYMNLRGANLSQVKSFNYIDVYGTAWWQADRMSPDLVRYLNERYPVDVDFKYGPDRTESFTRAEYDAAVARLMKIPSAVLRVWPVSRPR